MTTSKCSKSLACIGDVHLLHNRNPTAYIATNLRRYLIPRIKDLSYLQLNGDWYDKSGIMSEHDVHVAADIIMEIMQECNTHGVVLRVLEGTASHDRGQLAMTEIWHKRWNLTNDLKYINQITLETIESLNMTVLHIPDNLPFVSSDAACDHIAELMVTQNVTSVDYAFCHGYFDYAVGYGAHAPRICFRPEQFHFVRKHVLCSHVHTAGQDRSGLVMYTKSFDRLAHGEEGPKGFLIVADPTDNQKVTFVENTHSMPFITVSPECDHSNCIDIVNADILLKCDPSMAAFVRLIHPDMLVRKTIREWITKYPAITFSDMSPTDTPATIVMESDADDFQLMTLPTSEQLPSVLFEMFNGEYSLAHIKRCLGVE